MTILVVRLNGCGKLVNGTYTGMENDHENLSKHLIMSDTFFYRLYMCDELHCSVSIRS